MLQLFFLIDYNKLTLDEKHTYTNLRSKITKLSKGEAAYLYTLFEKYPIENPYNNPHRANPNAGKLKEYRRLYARIDLKRANEVLDLFRLNTEPILKKRKSPTVADIAYVEVAAERWPRGNQAASWEQLQPIYYHHPS